MSDGGTGHGGTGHGGTGRGGREISPMAKIVALAAGKLVLLAIVVLGVLYYLN